MTIQEANTSVGDVSSRVVDIRRRSRRRSGNLESYKKGETRIGKKRSTDRPTGRIAHNEQVWIRRTVDEGVFFGARETNLLIVAPLDISRRCPYS